MTDQIENDLMRDLRMTQMLINLMTFMACTGAISLVGWICYAVRIFRSKDREGK